MKLYTEEQVRHAIKMARISTNIFTTPFLYDQDEVLEMPTYIQLPSDEEIHNEAFKQTRYSDSFIRGAKWMRDKLTSGNNERK